MLCSFEFCDLNIKSLWILDCKIEEVAPWEIEQCEMILHVIVKHKILPKDSESKGKIKYLELQS